jgi:hypothetical protein
MGFAPSAERASIWEHLLVIRSTFIFSHGFVKLHLLAIRQIFRPFSCNQLMFLDVLVAVAEWSSKGILQIFEGFTKIYIHTD